MKNLSLGETLPKFFAQLQNWFDDLITTFDDMPGRKCNYPPVLIMVCAYCKLTFHLKCRQLGGFCRFLCRLISQDAPSYVTIWRRIQKIDLTPILPRITPEITQAFKLAIDSTGLKIKGAGEWCAESHRTKVPRKAWAKMHAAVNVETHEIAMHITTEAYANDSPYFKPLLEGASRHQKPQAVYADIPVKTILTRWLILERLQEFNRRKIVEIATGEVPHEGEQCGKLIHWV